MIDQSLLSLPDGISIAKDRHILEGAGSVAFSIKAQPGSDVLAALVTDTPFPLRKIELGEISIHAEAEKPIVLDGGKGKVTFSGKTGASSGAAVLNDPADAIALLVRDRINDQIAAGLALPEADGRRYLALRWGYDLEGAAKGSVALGVGASVTFGAEGKRLGAYTVLRSLEASLGAASALKEALGSWMLPTQFRQLDDLAPGTWIVTEVDGSLALKVGAQYGYDFNWVREAVALGGLSGDIGLKIQLGVSAMLGFEASGQYGVALSRPLAGRRVRVQLFRLNRKGLNFAFAAGGSAQASFNGLLPDNFDDFIQGVLGPHPLQVLADLDEWTDPDQNLSDLLAGVTDDYAKGFLKDVTGIDPDDAFEAARGRLVDLLRAWHALPHNVAGTLYSMLLKEAPGLAVLRATLARFASQDATTFKPELEQLLGHVNFFKTPFGKWLESAALTPVLTATSDTAEYARLQQVANQTLAVLDGSLLEKTLVNLQRALTDRLGLGQIESAIDETTFEKVDEWLKARLASFLGHAVDTSEIQKVRETVHRLLALRETFFEQARKALTRKYEFQLLGRYQKATTRTALVDVEFDFDAPHAAAAELVALATAVLAGDFNQVLQQPVAGVALHEAVLTHEIKRQTHLELTLPFFHAEIDHVNKSLARAESVDADRGRILIYDLSADDLVTAKNKFSSRFAVQGRFARGTGVRVFDEESMTHSYVFRQAVPKMRRKALEAQMKTYVGTYFPNAFIGGEASVDTWISDLDRTIDDVLSNGPDNFGNTLMSLELSAPSRLVGAWTKAPLAKKAEEYYRMSVAIQAQLKRLIPLCHFQDVRKYTDRIPSAVLLTYAAIEPATNIIVDRGHVVQFQDKRDVYWDFDGAGILEAMVRDGHTLARLRARLVAIHDTLRQADGMAGSPATTKAAGLRR